MHPTILYQEPAPPQNRRRQPPATAAAGKKRKTRNPRRFHLTERMLLILTLLHTASYARTDQIRRLFFEKPESGKTGPVKATEKCMRKLFEQGFVRRIEQPVKRGEGRKPYIYALDKQGAGVLAAHLAIDADAIDWQPKSHEEHWPFMDHLLATLDVRIAVTRACERLGASIVWWLDERELRSTLTEAVPFTTPDGKEHKARLIPDAAFLLERRDGKRILCMAEVDMGNVTLAPSFMERRGWLRKVRVYTAFAGSDLCRRIFGDYAPTVLTITTSPLRRKHLQEVTHNAGGGDLFLFSLLSDAADPDQVLTGCIWYTTPHVANTAAQSADDPMALVLCSGVVLRYDPTEGVGILRAEETGAEVAVRNAQLRGVTTLKSSDAVEFICRKGASGLWADEVTVVQTSKGR
jgi:cold shock CspA family protein